MNYNHRHTILQSCLRFNDYDFTWLSKLFLWVWIPPSSALVDEEKVPWGRPWSPHRRQQNPEWHGAAHGGHWQEWTGLRFESSHTRCQNDKPLHRLVPTDQQQQAETRGRGRLTAAVTGSDSARSTWVYLSLHSQTDCCQSSLHTQLHCRSFRLT